MMSKKEAYWLCLFLVGFGLIGWTRDGLNGLLENLGFAIVGYCIGKALS